MKAPAIHSTSPVTDIRQATTHPIPGKLLVAVALLLGACATAVPVQRHAELIDRGSCSEDRVFAERLAQHPGVRVTRTISGFQVRIRAALQEPLFIVDGLQLAPTPGGALHGAITACDIERIRVLSDPADLTFYGARGANGVVLITTRRR